MGNNVNYNGRDGVGNSYNYLNLPQNTNGNQNPGYMYDTTGGKLRKVSGNMVTKL